jgi:hypothetical protein
MTRALLLVLAVGCSGGKDDTSDLTDTDTDTDTDADSDSDTDTDSDTDADADSDADTDTVLPGDLNGTPPDEALPAPEFTATAMDGTPRTQPDLMGQPTVLWFYPAAFTGG